MKLTVDEPRQKNNKSQWDFEKLRKLAEEIKEMTKQENQSQYADRRTENQT